MKKLAFIVTVAALAILAGCASPAWDVMDVILNETIGPEYEAYIDADPNMPPDLKTARKMELQAARRQVEELRDKGEASDE